MRILIAEDDPVLADGLTRSLHQSDYAVDCVAGGDQVVVLREQHVVGLVSARYGWDEEVGANAIEVYVHRLRRKLEPAGVVIRTIRGLGYLLEKPANAPD